MVLKTWQRNEGANMRSRVPLVNEGGRLRLYDEELARAFLAGSPRPPGSGHDGTQPDTDAVSDGMWPPAVPPGETHPDDLLTDQEAAAVLETRASTVRGYGKDGHLPIIHRHGRTWYRRADLEARISAADQRHQPVLTAVGPLHEAEDKAPRPHLEPFAAEIATAPARVEGKSDHTTSAAEQYGTGERLD
ncbi:helix-turn-helix domain-containing protein [Streptomyces zhihengii]|uniref:Helix-turn-helix domain-containing protein n=1 Tax=Streptomyces zhihengii TaxID=1818004 RepID=A0ABS2V564_9ACTN|nr:helix-turn-helix domain-containing protein [Streptomyces zhihengii]MBM9624468.1 helix-turn-helix domain-containing protein [Streptomyces zhihengii]